MKTIFSLLFALLLAGSAYAQETKPTGCIPYILGNGQLACDVANLKWDDANDALVINDMTVSGDLTVTGDLSVTGSVESTAAVSALGDTYTVTAADAGKVIAFGKTDGTEVDLPAATGTGNVYQFVIAVTATSSANKISVAPLPGTDVMDGSLNIQQDTDSDGTSKVWRADADDDSMAFAGAATSGGIVGGYIRCADYKTGFWSCQAFTQSGGGAEATPFDATVSAP